MDGRHDTISFYMTCLLFALFMIIRIFILFSNYAKESPTENLAVCFSESENVEKPRKVAEWVFEQIVKDLKKL